MDRLLSSLRSLPLVAILVAAVAACAAGWARSCGRAGEGERAAQVVAQQGALAAAGIASAASVDRKVLAGRLEGAQRYTAGLEELVARAQRAVPGLRPVVVVTGSTGPVVAGGATSGAAPVPGEGPPNPPVAASPGRACLLYEGDTGEVRVAGAALESREGAVAVVGMGEAWRLSPDQLLFGGPLRLEVAREAPPARDYLRFGAGGRAQCVSGGCALGLAGVYQPRKHLELQVDAAFLGSEAAKGAGLSALVRF